MNQDILDRTSADRSKPRLVIVMVMFGVFFGLIGAKLAFLGFVPGTKDSGGRGFRDCLPS